MINISKKILYWLICLFLCVSCGIVKPIPIKEEIKYTYKDSTIVKIVDSIRVIPIEKLINITLPNQVSNLETTLAQSSAYTDSLGFLHHSLENKQQALDKTHVEYVYKDRIDSVYVKTPVPYEVEKQVRYVPRFYKWLLVYSVLLTLVFIAIIYLKFKK